MTWLALALALGAAAPAAPDAPDTSGTSPAPSVTPPAIPEPPTAAATPPPTSATPAAAAAPSLAKSIAPKPRPRLSPQLTTEVSTQLPAWSPPPARKADEPQPAPPPGTDPTVVKMKPVVVLGDKLPRLDDKEWLTPKALEGVLKKEYLSEFDRSLLNRYTLPLFGISQEARARIMYEEDKRLQDLRWMNDQIDQLSRQDPAAANELGKVRDQLFTRTSGQ